MIKMDWAKVEEGDKVRIISMYGQPQYAGREGIVACVDDIGQIHGSWGGCAIVPEFDDYEVIEEAK